MGRHPGLRGEPRADRGQPAGDRRIECQTRVPASAPATCRRRKVSGVSNLHLTFACGDYDRTRALEEGTVRPDGIDLTYLRLPVEETFFRMMRHREFEVAEMSLSSYVKSLDTDERPFVALPVYTSRQFRHAGIFVHADSGISEPADLVGKVVGTPEWQLTAGVWIRGILADSYG